jgi:hypothetical protein
MEPCGCKFLFYGQEVSMGGEISFCPLHKAAPDMRAALKECVAVIKRHNNSNLSASGCGWNFKSVLNDVVAVIAKAEGK